MRLFINNTHVDLSEDDPILINRAIADIREPENRDFDYTKTIIVPATANNRKLFTHIYDLHYDIQNTTSTNFTPDFNPNLKAEARVEELPYTWSGYAQLLKINIADVITFELQIIGKAGNFFKEVGNKLLSELDFTRFNHTWNIANISNSWNTSIIDSSASAGTLPFQLGRGYMYPMIDNGFVNPNNVPADSFKPALYAKQIVDEIFTDAGYTYSIDSFFNETFFKKLIVPYSKADVVLSDTSINGRLFRARRSSDQTGLDYNGDVIFNDDSSTGYYDNGSDYNTGTGRYVTPDTGKYRFKATIDGTFIYTGAGSYISFRAYFAVYNYTTASVITVFGGTIISDGDLFSYTVTSNEAYCSSGDSIGIKVYNILASSGTGYSLVVGTCDITIDTDSTFENIVTSSAITFGGTMDMSSVLPDIEQRVFLLDIIRMFNLYVDVSEDGYNELVIKTRDDYYTTDVIDMTGKVDTVLEVLPMAELNGNPYHYTYSSADDAMNTIYEGETGTIYGRKRYFINNDFINEEKKIQLSFIPTLSSNDPAINDRVLPVIRSIDGSKTSNPKLRLLIYPSLITCQTYTIYDPISGSASTKTQYPFTGMTDHPVTPSAAIWFGSPEKQYYNRPQSTFTDNNLFNAYHRKNITEITDKNSKVIVMMVDIRPADMVNWSFDKLYYYDHAYYRLNKIIDYNPAYRGDLTKCEFLKLVTGITFTATSVNYSGGSGQVGVDYLPPADFVKLPIDDKKKERDDRINIDSNGKVWVTNSENINVGQDTNNIVIDNSSNITIYPNVTNVKVSNSNNLEVHESDTIWVSNIKQSVVGLPNSVVIDADYTSTDEDIIIFRNASADIDLFLPPLASAVVKPLTIVNADNVYDIEVFPDDTEELFKGIAVSSVVLTNGQSVTIIPKAGYWIVLNKLI